MNQREQTITLFARQLIKRMAGINYCTYDLREQMQRNGTAMSMLYAEATQSLSQKKRMRHAEIARHHAFEFESLARFSGEQKLLSTPFRQIKLELSGIRAISKNWMPAQPKINIKINSNKREKR